MRRTVVKLLSALLGCALSAPCLAGPATASGDAPRFEVPAEAGQPLRFVVYGDTRFTSREGVANAHARRALADRIALENPAAILIGGDLVYEGSSTEDYEVYRKETEAWTARNIRVFPALGNHERKGCDEDLVPCLENWWSAFAPLSLRPYRWYSVALGPTLLALVLDSDSSLRRHSEQMSWFVRQVTQADEHVRFIVVVMHYPPVRDPVYPRARDEQQIARFLARNARALHARVVVVGSHLHNYERFERDGVTYLVSGGGGAKPVPAFRMFGELSKLSTSVNFHFLRFVLDGAQLSATMVRFDADYPDGDPWSEPDHFAVTARPEGAP